jgi:putative colanic acid biosynthesis UDP-glucose lipid carrier transferase
VLLSDEVHLRKLHDMTADYSGKMEIDPFRGSRSVSVDTERSSAAALTLSFWVQWSVSVFAMGILLSVLAVNKMGQIEPPYITLGILTLFVSYPIYSLLRVYDQRAPRVATLLRLSLAWATVIAVLGGVGFVTKTSATYSREVLLVWFSGGWALQTILMFTLDVFFKSRLDSRFSTTNALVLGSGEFAQLVADKLNRNRICNVVGLVNEIEETEPNDLGLYPIIGYAAEIRDLIDRFGIKRLFIAFPSNSLSRLEAIYLDLLDTHVDVVWLPDFGNTIMLNHSVGSLDGLPAIYLNESPLTAYPSAALVKSAIDRAAALFLLVISLPIFLLIALAIKASSPGPVFFRQDRHGLNGIIFPMWKFRSMYVHEAADVEQAKKGDKRVSKVGAFIRKTSLDELPQLFNVLLGQMSLVGPRPHAVEHNDYFAEKIQAYMARHKVKPGMTGWAQVNGARGETETVEKMKRRLELDLEYINNWSLWLDLQVLLKTPISLLRDEAY